MADILSVVPASIGTLVPFLFVLGLIVGSFLNVVILRTQSGERITGRSHCMHCGTTLRWFELVPLVSYLAARGRCRTCKAGISMQYPLVEFLTGLLFVLVLWLRVPVLITSQDDTFYFLLSTFYLLLDLAIWSTLLVVAVYDFKTKLIPNVFSYTFAGLALVSVTLATLVVTPAPLLPVLFAQVTTGVALYIAFYALWFFSGGRALGLGDAKLVFGIGVYLGPMPGVSAVVFAFWVGAAVSLGLIAYSWIRARLVTNTSALSGERKQLTLKSEVPFGPFLVTGFLIVYATGYTMQTLFG